MEGEHFEAVVVGSGFGGSVMAHRLAEGGLRVCLLERGEGVPARFLSSQPLQDAGELLGP